MKRKTWGRTWTWVCALTLVGAPLLVLTAAFLNAKVSAPFWGASVCCWILGAVLIARWLVRPLALVRRVLEGSRADSPDHDNSIKSDPMIGELIELTRVIERQYEQEYTLEMLKKEAELGALQSQINPHFLYNTLDSIRGRLIGEGLSEESKIVESLSNLFRYSISPRTVYNTLEQELENVENYMRIMRYRFGDRLQYTVEVDEESPFIYHCELPKLTLQPLVENAIGHGMEKRAGGGKITVRASITEAGLAITVEDDGAGMEGELLDKLNHMFKTGTPAKPQSESGGIALYNVNERIRMRYGDRYGLTMYSGKGLGTQVNILLPVMLMPEGSAAGSARATP